MSYLALLIDNKIIVQRCTKENKKQKSYNSNRLPIPFSSYLTTYQFFTFIERNTFMKDETRAKRAQEQQTLVIKNRLETYGR